MADRVMMLEIHYASGKTFYGVGQAAEEELDRLISRAPEPEGTHPADAMYAASHQLARQDDGKEKIPMSTICPECQSPIPMQPYFVKNDAVNASADEVFTAENSHACINAWHVAIPPSEGTGPTK